MNWIEEGKREREKIENIELNKHQRIKSRKNDYNDNNVDNIRGGVRKVKFERINFIFISIQQQ